ncbi:MAG TPA: cytochrome-c oxidase, cbb3-type subunit III [Steroidobacter sp.]|nr:cytochrome-c oxidase, cbb3-type subunit III [Steroidobacteraceae bacterium]HLS81351.1 cytochrome-c oxidase, cbb3-type subunit III [Steroidobacter sp.]
MSHPASLFVIAFTTINIAACVWLMWWTARTRAANGAPPDAQPSADGAPAKTGHVWDGDLEEYNNPLPRWWLGLFILTIIFAVGYLVFYPGLGAFKGVGGWSSVAAYESQMELQRAKFEERMAPFSAKSLLELASDPQAMSTARNLFGANCSTCHGSDARGARGFPNLTDDDWLWGGDEHAVHDSIANGRRGVMPALGEALGPDGVNEVASYVLSLSGQEAPADWVAAGKPRFEAMCAACHGANAKGNPLLGAPNLTDEVWLHGGDFESVRATITNGRSNEMPAHRESLGETKVRLLAAYVLSLGGGRAASSPASQTHDRGDQTNEGVATDPHQVEPGESAVAAATARSSPREASDAAG